MGEAIRSHQGPSGAIRGHPKPSEATRGHQGPSEAIRSHQGPPEAIGGYPRPSEAIRGHQGTSVDMQIHSEGHRLFTARALGLAHSFVKNWRDAAAVRATTGGLAKTAASSGAVVSAPMSSSVELEPSRSALQ